MAPRAIARISKRGVLWLKASSAVHFCSEVPQGAGLGVGVRVGAKVGSLVALLDAAWISLDRSESNAGHASALGINFAWFERGRAGHPGSALGNRVIIRSGKSRANPMESSFLQGSMS